MELCCDLEVDVNGEEIFMVNKKIMSSFSGRLRKMFGKSTVTKTNLKVFFIDFPGGANGFELVTRFVYNNDRIEITPSNISILHCAAHFMEIRHLIEKTEKNLENIHYWTYSELLQALKQSQNLFPISYSSGLIEKYFDSFVTRHIFFNDVISCPSTSSPDSSILRLSCDTRSTGSFKTSMPRSTWWFEDLTFYNPELIEILVKSMIARKLDHAIISKFLFYYQKSKFIGATSLGEKKKISEKIIDMLYALDLRYVPCRNLFGIFRVSRNLKMEKSCISKLESMIGSQMDQATLDNLLVQSPLGTIYLYDVNLVLRFLKAFLHVCKACPIRLKKVASLMDLYLNEVAPDPSLKCSKFLALVTALPECARESYDGVYHASNMYLEVHPGLSEKQKTKIFDALNYDKLSSEVCVHLAHNPKVPSKTSLQALISQQAKLKSLIDDTTPSNPNSSFDHSTDNEKLKQHLQGMQCRVMELEKVCNKMQTQIAKIMKAKSSSSRSNVSRSLPMLCS